GVGRRVETQVRGPRQTLVALCIERAQQVLVDVSAELVPRAQCGKAVVYRNEVGVVEQVGGFDDELYLQPFLTADEEVLAQAHIGAIEVRSDSGVSWSKEGTIVGRVRVAVAVAAHQDAEGDAAPQRDDWTESDIGECAGQRI